MELDKIIALLYRRESGRAKAEDQEALQCVQDRPEFRGIETDIAKLWGWTGRYGNDLRPDVEAGLERLQQRIDNDRRIRRISFRRRLAGIAAAILLLLAFAWWRLASEEAPRWQVVATAAKQRALTLPDGTTVVLNQHSELTYPETFSEVRELRLTGEAFFSVAPQPDRPFVVHTPMADIRVLGTQFNLRSYPGEAFTEVVVAEGKVELRSPEGERLELQRMEKGVCRPGAALERSSVPNLNARAWQTGRLHFDKTPLPQVLKTLERHFAVEIELDNAALADCTFSNRFDQLVLEDILEVIELVFEMESRRLAEDKYLLTGGNCQ